MNEFEKRINALRIQFRNERIQIAKDAYRQIGHLNTAISQTSFQDVRDALRAEKQRVYEAMRTSHSYNRTCYMQQLEAIEDEYHLHREKHPSKREIRLMLYRLCRAAEDSGENTLSVSFGNGRRADISFS